MAALRRRAGIDGRRPRQPGPIDLAQIRKETDIACVYHCDFGDRSVSRKCCRTC